MVSAQYENDYFDFSPKVYTSLLVEKKLFAANATRFIRKKKRTWCFNPKTLKPVNHFTNMQTSENGRQESRRQSDLQWKIGNHTRNKPEVQPNYVSGNSLTLISLLPFFSPSSQQVSVASLCGYEICLHLQ